MSWKLLLLGSVVPAAVAIALVGFWPAKGEQVLLLHGVVETQEVRLGSKIGGRVESVAVKEGIIVEQNKPLVTFEAPELESQRLQCEARLRQAEADRDKWMNGPRTEEKEAARLAVEAARERWKRLQAGPRKEDIQQARGDLESGEATLKLARQKCERSERLYRQDAGGLEDYETARADVQRCRGQVNKAQAFLDLLLAGSRPEDLAEAASMVQHAQANFDLLLAGTRVEDKAAAEARVLELRGKLQEVEANLREAVVRAPDRVAIEVLSVRKGDLVAPNQPIIRVTRADDLWVKIYVPETQLGSVRLGQQVEIKIDSYPDQRFTGTIEQIGSESEFTPRNVQSSEERRHEVFGAKVHVVNAQGIFKSGMAAEVSVPLHD